jgi:hypothetical protein
MVTTAWAWSLLGSSLILLVRCYERLHWLRTSHSRHTHMAGNVRLVEALRLVGFGVCPRASLPLGAAVQIRASLLPTDTRYSAEVLHFSLRVLCQLHSLSLSSWVEHTLGSSISYVVLMLLRLHPPLTSFLRKKHGSLCGLCSTLQLVTFHVFLHLRPSYAS